jgi:hypothetical protein
MKNNLQPHKEGSKNVCYMNGKKQKHTSYRYKLFYLLCCVHCILNHHPTRVDKIRNSEMNRIGTGGGLL